jgi:hypothetical protein
MSQKQNQFQVKVCGGLALFFLIGFLFYLKNFNSSVKKMQTSARPWLKNSPLSSFGLLEQLTLDEPQEQAYLQAQNYFQHLPQETQKKAIPFLILSFESPNPYRRRHSLWTLELFSLKEEPIQKVFSKALMDPFRQVQWSAIRAIGNAEDSLPIFLPELLLLLKAGDVQTAIKIAITLGKIAKAQDKAVWLDHIKSVAEKATPNSNLYNLSHYILDCADQTRFPGNFQILRTTEGERVFRQR